MCALLNFAHFLGAEPSTKERNKLLSVIFEQVWIRDRHVVAVNPVKRSFPISNSGRRPAGVKNGSDGTQTRDCHPIEIRE
jgi:hypothetical protein